MAATWSEVGADIAEESRPRLMVDQYGTMRRPTHEERTTFYGPEPDPQPAIMDRHAQTTTIPNPLAAVNGPGEEALLRASEFAEIAGKTRTALWLRQCAEASRVDGTWPDAPAYKGTVVHVENPGPDLEVLDRKTLAMFASTVLKQCHTMGIIRLDFTGDISDLGPPAPVPAPKHHPRGGADQWNGPVGR